MQLEVGDEQNPKDSPLSYQRTDGMTLETTGSRPAPGPQPLLGTGQSSNTQVHTRPLNYVVRPDALGAEPDYVDCLWCSTRQKTTVKEKSSNMTRYPADVASQRDQDLLTIYTAASWP